MKFLIAFSDLQSLLKSVDMSHLKKKDTFVLSACAARVFIDFKGVVGGLEMLVLSDGSVKLSAQKFAKLITTYEGTRFLSFEGGPDGLKIRNFTMPVIAWNPQPEPPADFKLFPSTALPEAGVKPSFGNR